MDSSERFELWKQTKLNKKLEEVLEFSEEFLPLLDEEVSALPLARPLEASDPEEDLDLTTCVRVRPALQHEEEAGFFQSVFVHNPHVLALESSFDFRNAARVVGTTVEADVAFGPDVDNVMVFSHVGSPLVRLAAEGGVGCVFVYGQKGSGKTHTAQGVLEGFAGQLFEERLNVRLYGSFVEITGNVAVDLLNDKVYVDIVEDKHGMITAVGMSEVEIQSSSQFKDLVYSAFDHRKNVNPLFENPTSGSHGVCKIRFENLEFTNAKSGAIYVVDLASSDSSTDPQAREAVQINLSLTALKDCIKNRITDEVNPQVQYQITYRQSKLTMFLKEAFDLGMKKPSKMFLIGCLSPSIADIPATLNTLKYYVLPLKVAAAKESLEDPESKNPVHWPNEEMKEWILENSGANVCVLCPWESGKDLLRVPENEFIRRVLQGNTGMGEGQASDLYNKLWTTVVQAKKCQWKSARAALEKTIREEDKDKDLITKIIEIGDISLDEEPPRNTAGETVLVFNNEENLERYEKKNKTMLKNEQKRKIQAHERSEAKLYTVLDVSGNAEPIGELKIPPYKKPEKMLIDIGENGIDDASMFDKFGDPNAQKFNQPHPRLQRKSENATNNGNKSKDLNQSRRNSVANVNHLDNMPSSKRRNSITHLRQVKNNAIESGRRNSVANINTQPGIPEEPKRMRQIKNNVTESGRRNSVANINTQPGIPEEPKRMRQIKNNATESGRRNSVANINSRPDIPDEHKRRNGLAVDKPNKKLDINRRNSLVDASPTNNNPALNRRNSITNVITISKDGRIENTIRYTPKNNLAKNIKASENASSSPYAQRKASSGVKRNVLNESKKNRRNSVANIPQTSPRSKPSNTSSSKGNVMPRTKISGNNASERRGTPAQRPVISRRNSVASMASDVTNATYTVDKFRNKFYIPL